VKSGVVTDALDLVEYAWTGVRDMAAMRFGLNLRPSALLTTCYLTC
jgi:hypothetical protein